MINEEFNRQINFIVQQQAQFASDIVELREAQVKTEQALDHVIQVLTTTDEVVTRLANVTHIGFNEVNAKINALIDAQIRTDEQLNRTDELLQLTVEQTNRTDELLKLTVEQVNRTDEQLKLTVEQVNRTDEQLKRTDKQLKRTDGQLSRTDRRQRSTDEALRKLIRQLSRGRNGTKKN